MAFLPIVERELRVGSRRMSTHWVRLFTTLVGVMVSFLFMLVAQLSGGFGAHLGPVLYAILTFYAFGLSLLAGVLLAADCLSEEKREGTLGLLFLTDLKGHDVVLGKFVAVGLSALYGLVAVLPVTALPLLMGGVTMNEYWRVSMALANTLFFSLAAGMLISSWSRDAIKAMTNTAGLLVLAVVGLPILGAVIDGFWPRSAAWYFTAVSPYYPFAHGTELTFVSEPKRYWISLLASHLFGWLLLLTAGWSLPRAWQDRPRLRKAAKRQMADAAGANPATSFGERAGLLEMNPVFWLSGRRGTAGWRALRWRAWVVAVLGAVITAAGSVLSPMFVMAGESYVLWIFGGLLKLFIAIQACRFFVEARRSGALELLLSTPLTSGEIISGQWLALRKLAIWPAIVLYGTQLVCISFLAIYPFLSNGNATFFSTGSSNSSGATMYSVGTPWLVIWTMLIAMYRAGVFAADFLALGWVGMWLALSTKKPNYATALTILFVLVLPKMAFCVPDLVIDVFFILWARQKLLFEFRATAMPQYRPVLVLAPARLATAQAGNPPVIGI